MHVLFANTGVQILCEPLAAGSRFAPEAIGKGWQYFESNAGSQPGRKPFVQWQVVMSRSVKLFLAVDTTCGRVEDGYICDVGSLDRDLMLTLDLASLRGLDGRPLGIKKVVEIAVRPLGSGDPKPVDMVIDLGNSRTGALLLEPGSAGLKDPALPFMLLNRYHLDAWDDAGGFDRGRCDRWFSSRTHWCTQPFRDPAQVTRTIYKQVKEFWGVKNVPVEEMVTPELFRDLSMARLGREAGDVTLAMRSDGELRTGVSSPKRYLWAADDTWLDGADWFMADPCDLSARGTYAARLQGRLLSFLHEDDRDTLIDADWPAGWEDAPIAPLKPRHAPRVMMVAALYELLCQAYASINSASYRAAAGDPARPRILRSLTLTYPSGMVSEERRRLELQARKAARIFHQTLGRDQPDEPHITLEIDEASAVHITYIWSELLMAGLDPELWFSLIGRSPSPSTVAETASAATASASPAAPGSERPAGGFPAPPPLHRPLRAPSKARNEGAEAGKVVRIACLDIGGGTTDFMIARYSFTRGIPDSIEGEVLERDGISVAGDQLVKRLLETIVVPAFTAAIGLDRDMVKLLFGPATPHNLEFRHERTNWMNRLLVPLAQRYLDHAVADDRQSEISHTDPDIVSAEVLESFESALNRIKGQSGYYAVHEPLGLTYDRDAMESVVYEVFRDMLFDFCRRIVARDCDVVLLAGQPTKLGAIRRLVQLFLPLAPSRIIPMYRHYAGTWYPYQDPTAREPGVIVDPKSAVVVGAAIHFLAKYGMLGTVKFSIKDPVRQTQYHWGVINPATSGITHLMFEPSSATNTYEFNTSQREVLIGRRQSSNPDVQASPVYLLKLDTGGRLGDIDVKVRLRRVAPDPRSGEEEKLLLESASGTIAGEEAVKDFNVTLRLRTLADTQYYLDTGGLDNIQLD